jgi:polyisoprenoid-binding protein YceI
MRSNKWATLAIALAFPVMATAATWEIDTAHSGVQFRVRHLGISKVTGHFSDFSGTIEGDPAHLESLQANVKIAAASISTADAKRDEHLKSADFFDVAKFPELTFVAKKVSGVKGSSFALEGDLTMHGVTKPVVLACEFTGAAKDPWGNDCAAFSASTKLNRKDYGILWNKSLDNGGVLVGEEVDVTIELEVIKKST